MSGSTYIDIQYNKTEVDIKSIKAAVNIVLNANIFQNAQKVRIM